MRPNHTTAVIPGALRERPNLSQVAGQTEKRLGLVQETAVITDEIEHHQAFLARVQAQPAAELLQKQHP